MAKANALPSGESFGAETVLCRAMSSGLSDVSHVPGNDDGIFSPYANLTRRSLCSSS
jgi:hypothetical protein